MNGNEPQQPGVREMMSMMRAENGVAKLLQKPVYTKGEETDPTVSQAMVIADLFNTARLDLKAMAEAAGLEMSVQRMTAETAAVLMQRLIRRESLELIERFNDLEDRRERVLRELYEQSEDADVEDKMAEHRHTKLSVIYSQPDPAPLDDGADEEADDGADDGADADEDDVEVESDGDGAEA